MLNNLTESLIACDSEESFETWFSLQENPSDALSESLPEIKALYVSGQISPQWVLAFGQFVLLKKHGALRHLQELLIEAHSALRDLDGTQYSSLLVAVCNNLNSENPVQSVAFLDELLTALLNSFRVKKQLKPADRDRLGKVLKFSEALKEQIGRHEIWQFKDVLSAFTYGELSQLYSSDVADHSRSCGIHLHFVEAIVEVAYGSPDTHWLEYTFKLDASTRMSVFDRLQSNYSTILGRVPEIKHLQNPQLRQDLEKCEKKLLRTNSRLARMQRVSASYRKKISDLKAELQTRVNRGMSVTSQIDLAKIARDEFWRARIVKFIKRTHVLHDATAHLQSSSALKQVYHQSAETYLRLRIEDQPDKPSKILWIDEPLVIEPKSTPAENQGEQHETRT